MMEYNAASVKFLLWHVETKETAKLLQEHSFDEIRRMVLEDNKNQESVHRVNLAVLRSVFRHYQRN